jgi:hypothetical protein
MENVSLLSIDYQTILDLVLGWIAFEGKVLKL